MLKIIIKLGQFLLSPKTIVGSIILGAIFGIYAKNLAITIGPIGNSYVTLLTMSIFPLICAIIIIGLARMLRNPAMLPKFVKLVAVFVISMLISASLGFGSVMIFKDHLRFTSSKENLLASRVDITPVHMTSTGKVDQAQTITPVPSPAEAAAKTSATTPETTSATPTPPLPAVDVHAATPTTLIEASTSKLMYFLKLVTPKNVFADLNEGLTIRVVMILLLVGIALGKVEGAGSDYILGVLQGISDIFKKIFHWILYLLPIGLFCTFAENAAKFDRQMFVSFLAIIGLICAVGLVLVILFNFVLSWYAKIPFYKPFQLLKKPILLAFTTMSTTVAVPQSVEILRSKLDLEKNAVDLTIPLGITINRQGNVYILAIISTVTMLFYHHTLGLGTLLMLIVLVGFLGSFAFGGGTLLIPIFIIIAKTLGTPDTIGIALLSTTDIFVFWINILVTLLANYSATVLVAKEHGSGLVANNKT